MPKCAHCEHGPSGGDGHPDLFTFSMGGDQIQFRCRTCGHMWMRRYGKDGAFTWGEPSGPPGMDLPGRRTHEPSRG